MKIVETMLNNIDKNDQYRVINNIEAQYYQKNLLLLYQPILGSGTIALYQTLLLDNTNNEWFSIDRLSVLTQKIISKLVIYLKRLMDFKLINILIKYNDQKKNLLIKINKPLSFIKFREHPLYWKELANRIGKNNFLQIANQWLPSTYQNINIANFEPIKNEKQKINNFTEVILKNKLSKFNNVNIDKAISKITNLSIVYNISNKKILEIIFNLSSDTKIISWVKINEAIFNFWKNQNNQNKNVQYFDKISIIKNLSVTKFINIRLNKPLTLMNIKLVTALNDIDIITSIKNLVIDFSILKNKKIVNNYTLKIIDTLTKLKITDFENAMKYLKNAYKAKKNDQIKDQKINYNEETYDIFN